jgi:hypothetical protein
MFGLACMATHTSVVRTEVARSPLPEAVLTESATDIDAVEAGELEWEANAEVLGARRGGLRTATASLEVEWRVFEELGLRLEPSFEQFSNGTESQHDAGIAAALAFGLFHDFERDEHLQLEVLAHTTDTAEHGFETSDAELPGAVDLVGAVRRGRFTLRGTVGAEAFGPVARAPLHTDLALLTGFLSDEEYGFLGLDVRADWTRPRPLVVAPEVVANVSPLGVPLLLSVALPYNVGAPATAESFGLLLRLTLLSERETAVRRVR